MAKRFVKREKSSGRLYIKHDGYVAYAPYHSRADDYQQVWASHPAGQHIVVRFEPRSKDYELWEIDHCYIAGNGDKTLLF